MLLFKLILTTFLKKKVIHDFEIGSLNAIYETQRYIISQLDSDVFPRFIRNTETKIFLSKLDRVNVNLKIADNV